MMDHYVFQRMESQTLPKFEGQDEDGYEVEPGFDVESIVNSCPDLSLLGTTVSKTMPIATALKYRERAVDGNLQANAILPADIPKKVPLSFRRSTSLNSLGGNAKSSGDDSTVDGNSASRTIVEAVTFKNNEAQRKIGKEAEPTPFIRSTLRASHSGVSGYLHKSVSSPSMSQYFGGVQKVLEHRNTQAEIQTSNKRSFFRRKNKSKTSIVGNPSHPAPISPYVNQSKTSNETMSESLGGAALMDTSLGLKEIDAECWALSMPQDVVESLSEKEVKRQEHIYEFILTEKHHCLTLALMDHLFVTDMKKCGFKRDAKLLFPDLKNLLLVHFKFFRRLRERQIKFRELGQPIDIISDILQEQFTDFQLHQMVRLYGLLCASYGKSLEIFKTLMKDQRFSSLVTSWDKQTLLGRKNVRECLLLVAQRITKYPLLIDPLLKTSRTTSEKELLNFVLSASRDLISKVNERVAERERLIEWIEKIDSKSSVHVNDKKRYKQDIIGVPSRRLLFAGHAMVNYTGSAAPVSHTGTSAGHSKLPCIVMILTDCLLFIQEIGGRMQFLSPHGMVMLNNFIVRENAIQVTSLYLVLGTGSSRPEMIELQVKHPPTREVWTSSIRTAKLTSEAEGETSDEDENSPSDSSKRLDSVDSNKHKILNEIGEIDRKIIRMLKTRSWLIESAMDDSKQHNPAGTQQKDVTKSVLSSLEASCNEVKKALLGMQTSSGAMVNRSVSCVSEYNLSHGNSGLPKRAETFGGFDSQQRIIEENQSSAYDNKIIFEMMMQLQYLVTEMCKHMVPYTSHGNQSNVNQFNKRVELMEELREAQQRLEAEKASWTLQRNTENEEVSAQKKELHELKSQLQKEQADIIQQREQLYRKLEALQRQGIRVELETVNLSPTTLPDKPAMTSRRSGSQLVSTNSLVSQNQHVSSMGMKKQQLPMHLASSSFKSSSNASYVNSNNNASPPNGPVTQNALSAKGSLGDHPYNFSGDSNSGNNVKSSGYGQGKGLQSKFPNSNSVSQILPLRLSESSSNKTSSLPRGMGNRSNSQTAIGISDRQPLLQSSTQVKLMKSEQPPSHGMASHLRRSDSNPSGYRAGMKLAYIPYEKLEQQTTSREGFKNGHIEHRRSDSSPVPMSSSVMANAANLTKGTIDDMDSYEVHYL